MNPRVRRWSIAVASIVTLGLIVPTGLAGSGPASAADPFTDARSRWASHLTGGSDFDPTAAPFDSAVRRITAEAQARWDSMIANPSTDLWPDLTTATSVADVHESYARLNTMTVAYATKGSALQGDSDLKADIITGLDWLYTNRYNERTKRDASTWYWALGIPMQLNDITVMLYSQLGADRIQRFMAAESRFLPHIYSSGPYSTGANRAWSVKVIALRGVILRDDAKTIEARDGLVPVMKYVTTGDGFYERGGFIQHTSLPYVGGYGISALGLISDVLYVFFGSPWQVTDPSVANIYNAVRSTYAPFMENGVMMDTVRGREISREYNQDQDAGSATIRSIALLARSATPSAARNLRAGVKRLLLDSDIDAYRAAASIDDLELSSDILNDKALAPAAALTGSFAFASMDRFVHHSAAFAYAVSGSSSRITNFETADNGENQKAWYTADGMTYLYTDDSRQYTGDFWATVNRYRLPGTTVDTRTKGVNDGRNYLATQNFAGGLASSSHSYGAFAMVLDASRSNLVANKAWFVFDDEIVALGSGISDPGLSGTGWDSRPTHVETIIDDRRRVSSDQTLTVDGTPITSASRTSFADPSWAQIAGTTGNIGYVFPGSAPVNAAKTAASGSWFDVNAKNGTTDIRRDTYFSLWADHGTAPTNAGYAYVTLPNSTLSETKSYAASPDTAVLVNSSAVSAVKEKTKNVVAATFWAPAGATVPVDGRDFLSASTKSMVITEESAKSIAVSITDPTQAATKPVDIEIKRAATRVVSASPGVTVTQLSPTIKMTVDTVGAAGSAFTVTLAY